jgi:tRNA dimethylallyltransferase
MRVIGLDVSRDELHRRIEARCHAMLEGGLIDEVRALHAAGFAPELPSLRSPGYVEIGEHVRGLCSLDDALARMARATKQLAKRQRTWFRSHPVDCAVPPDVAALLRAVDETS